MKKWLNYLVEKGVDSINEVADFVEDHEREIEVGKTFLSVAAAHPAVHALGREITKDRILASIGKCGKSGLAGGAIDGLLGAGHAMKLYRAGLIDRDLVVKHTLQEASCGVITSGAGTAGTVVVALAMGGMGPAALIVGMGASVGARYAYRSRFESVLPDLEEAEEDDSEQDLEEILEEINYVILEDEDEDDSGYARKKSKKSPGDFEGLKADP